MVLKSQTQSPRRRELEILGLIVDTGETRQTRLHRDASVWVATQQGLTVWRQAAFQINFGENVLMVLTGSLSEMWRDRTKPEPHSHMWHFEQRMYGATTHPGYDLYRPVKCSRCAWDWLASSVARSPEPV
jgi:hypothetical protein